MPRPVRRRFAGMTKVCALAHLDPQGCPVVAPVLSLQPKGDRTLVCAPGPAEHLLSGLQPGAAVAANLLTLDVVSFQVKGTWLGDQRRLGVPLGAMSVQAVYAGGPPIPGRQIA